MPMIYARSAGRVRDDFESRRAMERYTALIACAFIENFDAWALTFTDFHHAAQYTSTPTTEGYQTCARS